MTVEQFPKVPKIQALLEGPKDLLQQSEPHNSTMTNIQPTPDTGKIASALDQQANENDSLPENTSLEPIETEDEPQDEVEDDRYTTEYENLAADFFKSITNRITEINKDAPTDGMNFTEFKSFWREKFDAMLLELDQTKEGDLLISTPPLKQLNIETLNNEDPNAHECPCCLYVDSGEAYIAIEAEAGITRKIFLEALRDRLYGEDMSVEDLRLSDSHMGRLVPRAFNYTTSGEKKNGKEIFCWMWDFEGKTIWLFCSDKEVPTLAKL
ncbi:MAG: hypothetical protein Q9163_003473 [Psora crenata]